jgi:hypothetical protein
VHFAGAVIVAGALALSVIFFLGHNSQVELFVVGAAALTLLVIGIHNAWDSITHIVVSTPRGDQPKED